MLNGIAEILITKVAEANFYKINTYHTGRGVDFRYKVYYLYNLLRIENYEQKIMALREIDVSGSASKNTITLRANGTLFLNKGVLRKINCEYAEAALFYIDDEKPLIAIKLIDEVDGKKNNCKKLLKDKNGVSVNMLPVLRYYDIEKQKKKIDFDLEKKEDLILLDVSKLLAKE